MSRNRPKLKVAFKRLALSALFTLASSLSPGAAKDRLPSIEIRLSQNTRYSVSLDQEKVARLDGSIVDVMNWVTGEHRRFDVGRRTHDLDFEPDGNSLILISQQSSLRRLSLKTGIIHPIHERVGGIYVDSEDERIAVARSDASWSVLTGTGVIIGQSPEHLPRLSGSPHELVLLPGAEQLVLISRRLHSLDKTILPYPRHEAQIWPVKAGQCLFQTKPDEDFLLISGSRALIVDDAGTIFAIDTTTGRYVARLPEAGFWREGRRLHTFDRRKVALDKEGRHLFLVDNSREGVWDLRTGRLLWESSERQFQIGFGFDPLGGSLILALEQEIKIIEPTTGKILIRMAQPKRRFGGSSPGSPNVRLFETETSNGCLLRSHRGLTRIVFSE